MEAIDNYYLSQPANISETLLSLRNIILRQDAAIIHQMKYGMPFFCFRGKMFCYLWVHKTFKKPYLGIVEGKRIDHPDLLIEKRSRMKIMLFDENEDLPIAKIEDVIQQALNLYKTGIIKTK